MPQAGSGVTWYLYVMRCHLTFLTFMDTSGNFTCNLYWRHAAHSGCPIYAILDGIRSTARQRQASKRRARPTTTAAMAVGGNTETLAATTGDCLHGVRQRAPGEEATEGQGGASDCHCRGAEPATTENEEPVRTMATPVNTQRSQASAVWARRDTRPSWRPTPSTHQRYRSRSHAGTS